MLENFSITLIVIGSIMVLSYFCMQHPSFVNGVLQKIEHLENKFNTFIPEYPVKSTKYLLIEGIILIVIGIGIFLY